MKSSLASKRYAKSLLTLALEKGQVEDVKNDMQLILQGVRDSQDLKNLLINPIVKAEKKQAVLKAIFAGKVSAITEQFIELIVAKGREAILNQVANAFIEAYKLHKNISTVEVTSAVKLTEDQKAKIMNLAAKQGVANAEVIEKIDADLIGGFVMRIGDQQIDASIQNRLNVIKQELIKN